MKDERAHDARSLDDLTPIPAALRPTMTAAEADLAVCQSTCAQLKLAYSALQEKYDQARSDRRALAARVKSLESKLASLTGETR